VLSANLRKSWQYADVGDAKNAKASIAEWERHMPADLRGPERRMRNLLDGLGAWAETRYADTLGRRPTRIRLRGL
jgi:hypothetical protein